MLALDLRKIGRAISHAGAGAATGDLGIQGREWFFAAEETHGTVERFDGVNFNAFDERSFLGRDGGQEQAAFAEGAGEPGDGEGAAHRACGAGETEFAGNEPIGEMIGFELTRGGEDAEGDGQVVEGSFLAEIARCEIDRGARARWTEATVVERGENAVGGFLDCGVGEADKIPFGVAGLAGVDLNLNQFGSDALQGGRGDRREHAMLAGRLDCGGQLPDFGQVGLDGLKVEIGAVGVGSPEVAINTLEFAV